MFDKLKELRDMQKKAKEIQKNLADEIIIVDKSGVKITINGNLKIQKVEIEDNIAKSSLEGILEDTVNEAIEKAQKVMAQKMMGGSGMGMLGQ